jgi:uncharacterized protein (TIGR00369 family)
MPVPPRELHHIFEEHIPFNRFLGIRVAELREGYARFELPYRPELIGDVMRPALHGGVVSSLIDAAGGLAVWSMVTLEDRVSTIDLRIDYLAPCALETLIAEAEVVRVGNRVGVIDARCTQPSAPDRVVATGKGVYNIKRKDE